MFDQGNLKHPKFDILGQENNIHGKKTKLARIIRGSSTDGFL